jgi:hypothetical protein
MDEQLSIKRQRAHMEMSYGSLFRLAAFALITAPLAVASDAAAQETVNVGETGFANKRPVFAAACPRGCPWGELGDFVKAALAAHGYEVVLCRNCNRDLGPRLVSRADRPPELSAQDTFVGTTTRVDAPVDFGVSSRVRRAAARSSI